MTVVLPTIPAAKQWVQAGRSAGKTIGLVPTMGAFHEGHRSLFRRARERCGFVVASVFVNPLQFGPGEDYARYPRDFAQDLAIAEQERLDAVFHPEAQEMYPQPPETTADPGKLGERLCGASRPGHFAGVATVVAKLLNIVQPDCVFFGQKDAQQSVIVRKMVLDLNFPVEIEICPTLREPDGLAMSSRNVYLSPEKRAQAAILYRSLRHAESLIRSGVRDAARVEQEMQEMIRAVPGAVIEYARVVDRNTLEEVRQMDGEVLVAVAVRMGRTRLIDNLLVAPPSEPRP
ncbi:MAG: pantoate--beta-alanine ligase [Acidobacteria bacterium RIFCSPLOWO2_12_FULL_60_22]|nr:MAG: pantoate--beta-alanine ligase [Acidobacteria bacterium RIFCSPLOWO2_12_FULL_60_22]